MLKLTRSRTVMLAIGLLGIASCASRARYPLITPLYPTAGARLLTVNSLTPTFRWQLSKPPRPGTDTTYDLVIYEAERARAYYSPVEWITKRLVYERQGLQESEHQIAFLLAPRTVYIWSVRYRQGTNVSDWARYDKESMSFVPIPGAMGGTTSNQPFVFVTP